jgi:hypothetical protein
VVEDLPNMHEALVESPVLEKIKGKNTSTKG